MIKTQKNEWKWRNLHRWQQFYTAAGTDGTDKFQLCIWPWRGCHIGNQKTFVWKTFLSADQNYKFKSQMLEIKVEILVLFSILIQDLDCPSTRWSVWSFIALHLGFEKHTANIFRCIRLHWSLLLLCSVFRTKEKEILFFEWELFQVTQPRKFDMIRISSTRNTKLCKHCPNFFGEGG